VHNKLHGDEARWAIQNTTVQLCGSGRIRLKRKISARRARKVVGGGKENKTRRR
jgi:hypothetical protein